MSALTFSIEFKKTAKLKSSLFYSGHLSPQPATHAP